MAMVTSPKASQSTIRNHWAALGFVAIAAYVAYHLDDGRINEWPRNEQIDWFLLPTHWTYCRPSVTVEIGIVHVPSFRSVCEKQFSRKKLMVMRNYASILDAGEMRK